MVLQTQLGKQLLGIAGMLLSNTVCGLTPTTTFETPVPLQAAGSNIDLGGAGTDVHAVPRIVQWNADGVADLLVFAGDGYLWRYLGSGPTTSTSFQAGTKVQFTNATDIRIGTGYTGGAFLDITNDGRPDLIIAGSDRKVRLLTNSGAVGAPSYVSAVNLQGASGDFLLPANCGSRIDVVDWNGDGLLDLIAGEFSGAVTFYANTGTASVPAFAAAGVPLSVSGTVINEAYNTHPRAFDINQDGIPDLVYGINWHYFQFCRRDSASSNDLALRLTATDPTGATINLRTANGDDSSPDFADLNGDGVVDLIDGGLKGNVVVMYGRPYTAGMTRIQEIMAAHPADLGATMAANTTLRDELFGLHWSLRDFAAQIQPALSVRTAIRDWYAAHIAAYPQYLPWIPLNRNTQQFVPSLAGQCWVNLLECMPDSAAHRTLVADAIGSTGWHRALITDFATLFVEDHTSSTAQQKALYDLQASLPPTYRVVERVTIRDFLVPTGATGEPAIKARTGVNIFSTAVGAAAEGFPSDVPQVLIDTYAVATAHELNHNVEAPATVFFPTWYRQRKSELLKQGSPALYVWTLNADGTWTWNLSATQAAFQTAGYWDGNSANWTTALTSYWTTGPAAGYDKRWLRDNLKFCIEAPQEAFATLSNQYFDSSSTMLQLALNRYGTGNKFVINQLLWFAETYALNTANTYFWRTDTAANVTRTTIPVRRGTGNHLSGLTVNGKDYDFAIAANGDVLATIPHFLNSSLSKGRGIATRAYTASLTPSEVFDPNPAAAVTFSKVSGPTWLSVASNGALTGTPPNGSAGTNTFTVRVTNGESQTGEATLQIPIITPFAEWQEQQFPNAATNPDALLLADPDHDGVPNLTEFALGTLPNSSSTSPVIVDLVSVGPDRFLRMTVSRSPAAGNVSYAVQATSNLGAPASWSGASIVILQDTATTLQVRDGVPIASGAPRFVRLLLTLL